jgi:N-acylglucosamine 2-epimerase
MNQDARANDYCTTMMTEAISLERRNELARFYRNALLKDCVPFWFPRSVDTEHGGFFSALDRDGTIVDTDKSVWAQGRMSWLLTLYNTVAKRPEWLEWGKSGLKFLNRHCFDDDGRMFFHVTREGRPIRKRRYAFSECFAAIAFAAYAQAADDDHSAHRAHELFDIFTRWNFTPGLMPPKFTNTRPMIGIGPRMLTIATAQELRRNLGDRPELTAWIDRCIEEIRRLFVKPDLRVVMETVGSNGEIRDHFDGRTLNPGHAIECAWFILQEGKLRGDAGLIRLGCNMLDWMWERGWDAEHGGIFYYRDLFGKPVAEYWQDMKFWWPHNEAIIATLLAWQLTSETRYAQWHKMVHDWSFNHFADSQHGEWIGYLHRHGGIAIPLKGNLWKSFFHVPRMEWYCWKLLEEDRANSLRPANNL